MRRSVSNTFGLYLALAITSAFGCRSANDASATRSVSEPVEATSAHHATTPVPADVEHEIISCESISKGIDHGYGVTISNGGITGLTMAQVYMTNIAGVRLVASDVVRVKEKGTEQIFAGSNVALTVHLESLIATTRHPGTLTFDEGGTQRQIDVECGVRKSPSSSPSIAPSIASGSKGRISADGLYLVAECSATDAGADHGYGVSVTTGGVAGLTTAQVFMQSIAGPQLVTSVGVAITDSGTNRIISGKDFTLTENLESVAPTDKIPATLDLGGHGSIAMECTN